MDHSYQDGVSSADSDPKNQTHAMPEHDERNHSSIPSNRRVSSITAAERARRNVNAKLANPLAGMSHATLENMGATYARKHQVGDDEDIRAFKLGACLAQDPTKYDSIAGLTEQELEVLRKEFTNRWSQPRLLYVVILLCSTCAAVQGMGKWLIPRLAPSILHADHDDQR